MKIWIDADACPRVVKDIVIRASGRLAVRVILVANNALDKHVSGLVTSVEVPAGPDVADDYIADHLERGDLVITADIPLAARAVARQAVALDPRGELYHEENIGERLAMRDLMMALRSDGSITGGPSAYTVRDRHRFSAALDRVLARLLRESVTRQSGDDLI